MDRDAVTLRALYWRGSVSKLVRGLRWGLNVSLQTLILIFFWSTKLRCVDNIFLFFCLHTWRASVARAHVIIRRWLRLWRDATSLLVAKGSSLSKSARLLINLPPLRWMRWNRWIYFNFAFYVHLRIYDFILAAYMVTIRPHVLTISQPIWPCFESMSRGYM